jgi:ribose transport system substrate-binding protein
VASVTDSQYEIAVEKAGAMKAEIQKCSGCSVLEYEDSPIADAAAAMPALVSDRGRLRPGRGIPGRVRPDLDRR